MEFVKPIVVVSKCLEFAKCRYDGKVVHDPLVAMLEGHVEFLPVCPELAVGLGTPRKPIRIVADGKDRHLVQPASGRDLTDDMIKFCSEFIKNLGPVDGFILKSRSPTCGLHSKVYRGDNKRPLSEPGFFASKILRCFPGLAIEDEGRLKNFTIRQHFLTKLFLLARFREMKKRLSIDALRQFHTDNKFILMAYNQSRLKQLGNIVANHKNKPINNVLLDYQDSLHIALSNIPRFSSMINVLSHMYSGISSKLSKGERDFFLHSVEEYRDERIPLSVLTHLINSWAVRFDDEYLLNQSFLNPYPVDLVDITDSGKGRDR